MEVQLAQSSPSYFDPVMHNEYTNGIGLAHNQAVIIVWKQA